MPAEVIVLFNCPKGHGKNGWIMWECLARCYTSELHAAPDQYSVLVYMLEVKRKTVNSLSVVPRTGRQKERHTEGEIGRESARQTEIGREKEAVCQARQRLCMIWCQTDRDCA